IAQMLLSQAGFTVETAENGKVAVDKVASSGGRYDLILMDIQMPVMDGLAATVAIRALRDPALSRVPILAMSANAFREDVVAAEKAGMNGYIVKPINEKKMMATLRKVLRK
ncbi:MAG: response regulator, partial [Clostridia bacterium]|nr:response regulator [Clostridia bacterium]